MSTAGFGAVAAAAQGVVAQPPDGTWLLPVVFALLSGATVLRLRSIAASVSLGDSFTFAALFLYGPDAATLTVAVETIAMSLRLKSPIHRMVFNTAAPCLAMWLAGSAVFRWAGAPLPPAADSILSLLGAVSAAIVLFFLLDSVFVATAVGLHEKQAIGRVWVGHLLQLWPTTAAGGYLGLLIAAAATQLGVMAVLALSPVPFLLYQTFRISLGRADDQLQHLSEINRMYQSTIEAFAVAVDAKDRITHGHIRRVQAYAVALAKALGAGDEATLKSLEAAALLHDLGKIAIPDHILNKPGTLTTSEFDAMKRHAPIGAEILAAIEFPFPVVPIVRYHHENWDGSGYPEGLRGTEIPLGARILSVVDCFDALTSDRPYRPALSTADAFGIIHARRGSMYDPEVVDVFTQLQPRLSALLPASVGTRGETPSGT